MTHQEQAALASTEDAKKVAQADARIQGYRLGDGFEQLKNARIMMIDDEPIAMEAAQAFLEDAGYRNFVLLEDSTRAMEQLRIQRPDVLLLDGMMPVVSGFDILGMLRKEPEFSHLPVIILTSSSDAATKLQALDLGATDLLSKPVDPSELALRLRNTLGAKAYQDQLAYYDILTSLPNRRLFMDRCDWAIERARRADAKVAMLHIVFDDFRRVVDTLGPKAGDDVLKQVAQRLTKNIRGADVVSHDSADGKSWADVFRVGSADFTVLAPSVRIIADAAMIGRRLIDAMREPLDADGSEIYLTPSIGVAGYPDDGLDTTMLLKRAVGASSQAMAKGGARLQFYSARMNQMSLRRLRMEAELRRAVEQREFRLLYQPKVEVASSRIIGAEALLRWPNKDGEIVSPADFIPVAEETGVILPIGEWVLGEACRQMARWRDEGIDLQLSVNISARQFFDMDLISVVRGVLEETGVDPTRLVLEMTESLLMDRVDLVIATLRELRGLGVQISIDDFGTGYSSLAYLKRFKVDEVKIDRSFVRDAASSPEDRALIKAVTYLSHKLGARVCAEGVETPDQLAFLAKVNCNEYQGFLCSRPVPPQAFAALCRQAAAAEGSRS